MILDFRHLVDDIDVRDIDANAIVGGNQAFRFIGSQAFNAAGQVRAVYNAAQQETVILFNIDNDAAAEMIDQIDRNVALSALDFIALTKHSLHLLRRPDFPPAAFRFYRAPIASRQLAQLTKAGRF